MICHRRYNTNAVTRKTSGARGRQPKPAANCNKTSFAVTTTHFVYPVRKMISHEPVLCYKRMVAHGLF